MNRFASPVRGWRGRLLDALANCTDIRAVRRAILGRLPFPVLASDVRDVIYANWVVPVEKVVGLVPDGMDLWQRDGRTILTILTYRHGHFGLATLGPLRRLFPSPLQSNWRLYLAPSEEGGKHAPTVLFIRNIFDSVLYAVGTRLFSDVLPSHWSAAFTLDVDRGGARIAFGGPGSSPCFALTAAAGGDRKLPADFAALFGGWQEAVTFLCLQDGAVAVVEDCERIAHSRISLPIDIAMVEPMTVQDHAPQPPLSDWGAGPAPFCFRVRAVHFRVLSERLLPRSPS